MEPPSGHGMPKSPDKPSEGVLSSKRAGKWNGKRANCDQAGVVIRENPFLNELIMCNILQHFSTFQELKPLRQVCRLWNTLTVYHWRPVGTIKLGANSENHCMSFEDFWRHYQDPHDAHKLAEKPFTRYILHGINLSDYPTLQILDGDPDIPNFWNTIGPIITYIRLDHCTFPGDRPDIFESIVTEKLPKLKTLVLIDNQTVPFVSFRDTYTSILEASREEWEQLRSEMKKNWSLSTIKISGETPMNLCELLIKSPSVQKLQLAGYATPGNDYKFSLLEVACMLKRILDTFLPMQLKHLDFMDMDIFNVQFNVGTALTQIPLPLKYLAVSIPCDTPSTQLTQICNMYGSTLEVLKVYRPPHPWIRFYKRPFPQRFPMESLSELYLYGNVIKNLIALKNMSNLKVLHVDPRCYNKLDRILGHRYPAKMTRGRPAYGTSLGKTMINPMDREKMRLERMEKLHLDNRTFLVSCATDVTARVATLHAWMPNLKVLETNLDLQGFRTVCRLMPRLEELVLLFESRVGDEALTGIKPGQTAAPYPYNITSFTNLKRFDLKSLCKMPETYDKNRLGDLSVFQGFLKMSTLQRVVISASKKMSEKAVGLLEGHAAHVQVIRNYDNKQLHGTGECCAAKLAMERLRNC